MRLSLERESVTSASFMVTASLSLISRIMLIISLLFSNYIIQPQSVKSGTAGFHSKGIYWVSVIS